MGPLVTARGLWSCGAWAQKLRQRIQSTRGLSGCGVWLQLLWGTQPGDWTHTMKWSPHSVRCKSIISYRYRVVVAPSAVPDSLPPLDCSVPGLPVLHQLLGFPQTHAHCVADAIQPAHPLAPLLLLPSIFRNRKKESFPSDENT